MKIINGCRRSGKSYKILEQLTERDLFITLNMRMARISYQDWIQIHNPKKYDWCLHKINQDVRPTFIMFEDIKSLRGYTFENIYIDNLDDVLDLYFSSKFRFSGKIIASTGAEIELLPIPEEVKKILAEHTDVDFIGNATVAE